MTATIQQVKEVVSVLTPEEKQLLRDTITKGFWGNTDYEFLDDNGNAETTGSYGYCTNDAKLAGHFTGRKISSMFRSIYRKLCSGDGHEIGRVLSHCSDWWENGSGDMLFIREGYYEIFEEWARAK